MKNKEVCGDCKARLGEFHEPGCDREKCPFCGGQLISCACSDFYFGIVDKFGESWTMNVTEEFDGYEAELETLTSEEESEWETVLERKGLIPFGEEGRLIRGSEGSKFSFSKELRKLAAGRHNISEREKKLRDIVSRYGYKDV